MVRIKLSLLLLLLLLAAAGAKSLGLADLDALWREAQSWLRQEAAAVKTQIATATQAISVTQSVTATQSTRQTPIASKAKTASTKARISAGETFTFREAKSVLREQVLPLHPRTLYCDCPLAGSRKHLAPDLAACNYQVRKDKERAARLEWEHVVPASEFGHQMQCWRQGGRKNCSGRDARFDRFEGDLHNLYPSVGEVNADRGNLRFGMIAGKQSQIQGYGQCEMRIDFKKRVVEPPARARGVIARTYLYMAQKHGIKLSSHQRQLFEAWHKQYPAQKWECMRHTRVAEIQGDANPWLLAACGGQHALR